jgi:hypothetical protein
MTMPDEMFNAIRSARHFMMALMDPKQTPKVPKEIRQRARDRLKHFPSEFDIGQLEKMHSTMSKDPNILFNECMKRLDSVRGELILAERKIGDVGNAIIETIKNKGTEDAQ